MEFFVFFLCFLSLIFIQLKLTKENLFNLANLHSIYWFLFLLAGFLVFKNDYNFNVNSFIWIFLASVSFFGGYIIFEKKLNLSFNISKRENKKQFSIDFKFIVIVIISCFVLNIIGNVLFLAINGIISDIFNSSVQFSEITTHLTEMRYEVAPANRSSITTLGNVAFYLGLIMYGFYFNELKKNKKYIIGASVALVISLIVAAFATMGKSPIIFAIIIIFSGFFIKLIKQDKSILNNYKKILIISLVAILALVFSLFMVTYLRRGTVAGVGDVFKTYGFGSIPAFDYYFVNLKTDILSYGKFTFSSLFSMLGLGEGLNKLGIFYLIDIAGIETNVFTVFRCLIEDFGLVGGIIFQFILGAVAGIATNLIVKSDFSPAYGILAIICVFIVEGFVISIGAFLSIDAALVIFMIYLCIIYFFNIKLEV